MTLLRRTPMPRATKPLPARSAKRKAHYASDEGKAGLAHMARVRSLPCIICLEWEMPQNSPTEAHHVKSGRFGNAKESDFRTIPLCHSHHNKLRPYPGDEDKIGFHNGQKTWEALYGPDFEWLDRVSDMLEGKETA